ncbi:hypothetical protein ACQPT2_15225 [Erwinia amylovora]
MNTEETICNLCGIQPELYISTSSYSLPPVEMTDPGYFLPVHWPAPRIVTRDRVVLAVSVIPGAKDWYHPGQWKPAADWRSLCSRPLHSEAASAYLIPLIEWYQEIERRKLNAGITIPPYSGLIKRKRL